MQMGSSPEKALSDPKLFLEFALENVLERLDARSLYVAQCLALSPTSKSLAEISLITEYEGDELRRAVMDLCAANLVALSTRHDAAGATSSYEVSNLARFYLLNKAALPISTKEKVRHTLNQINVLRDTAAAQISQTNANKYVIDYISLRSTEDAAVGKILKEALFLSKQAKYQRRFPKLKGNLCRQIFRCISSLNNKLLHR